MKQTGNNQDRPQKHILGKYLQPLKVPLLGVCPTRVFGERRRTYRTPLASDCRIPKQDLPVQGVGTPCRSRAFHLLPRPWPLSDLSPLTPRCVGLPKPLWLPRTMGVWSSGQSFGCFECPVINDDVSVHINQFGLSLSLFSCVVYTQFPLIIRLSVCH